MDLGGKYWVPSELSYNCHPANENSYISAMRSLQEKFNNLQKENIKLKKKIMITEDIMKIKKRDYEGKLETLNANYDKEIKKLQYNIETLETENLIIQQELEKNLKLNNLLKKEIQQITQEKRRHLEQNSVNYAQWNEQNELLMNEIINLKKEMRE